MKFAILSTALITFISLSAFSAPSSSHTSVIGTPASNTLKAMLKAQFSGADATSGGTIAVYGAQIECDYRTEDSELHNGTSADYLCTLTDDDKGQNKTALIQGLTAKALFDKMQNAKFKDQDATSGGVNSIGSASIECVLKTQDNETYSGRPSDSRCDLNDESGS